MSNLGGTFKDPTVLLVVGCMSVPLVYGSSWHDCWVSLFDPWFLSSLGILAGAIYFANQGGCVALSGRDGRVANWYLLNGAIIHYLLDGLSGGFGKVPAFRLHYEFADQRYLNFETTVVGISALEIFVMTPLCIAVYYGYKKQASWRPAIEICCASFQLAGTLLFAGTEIASGFTHVLVHRDNIFSPFNLMYFWFIFVICNILWFTVTTRLIATCVGQISDKLSRAGTWAQPHSQKAKPSIVCLADAASHTE